MSSILSIDHSSISAERILSRLSTGTAKMQSRSGPGINPEPPASTMLSASGADDGTGPGVPRAHPPEAADNLLARLPLQHEKLKTETGEPVQTPPDPPGQLAVLLLSMISQAGSPSGSSETTKRTLDIMA